MFIIFERKELSRGVYFSKFTDARFKANHIGVRFFTDFEKIPRGEAALAAYELAECCERFPDYSKLSAALLDLYDASLSTSTTLRWDKRCTEITGACLDDRYALSGERLETELARLMCDCIFRPRAKNGAFDEKITEMMRAELIDSIDGVINDKSHYAAQNAAKTAYVGEAGELPASGLREGAEKVTAKSAFSAYREILRTARVEITAAGCSDFSETESIFSEEFSKIERGDLTELSCAPSALKENPARVFDTLDMQQAILRMYFKAPALCDRQGNMLFSRILGGMTTSRLFMNIREKQSLCYYCSCYSDRSKRVLTCYAGIEPQNKERVEKAIAAELADIAENGVSEDELTRAKLEVLNQLRTVYDSPSGIMNWYMSQLCDEEFVSPEEYAKGIEAVTKERVRDAARLYKLDTVYTLCGK